ncbi:hypothetical protein ABH935_009827 [Catenulispora sp. GAS73]|uniref:hypothetical protein n=1 Tax=Catenulispora sp. GAS73 TaxID=3156269 RepID=UPI0035139005
MSQNPNWPVLVGELNPTGNSNYGLGVAGCFADLTGRLIQQWGTARGRQFELDEVQPGTWSGVWDDRDGALDPSNTASMFAPNLVPYRPWRIRAQWPATVNLLSADQATGGEGTPLAPGTSGAPYLVTGAYATPVVTASASAWSGTQVWQVTTASAAVGSALVSFGPLPVRAGAVGLPYAFSARIRSATASANPTVAPSLAWLDTNGRTLSTTTVAPMALIGSATGGWTFAGVPDVVPVGAVAAVFALTMTVAPTASWSFQVDGAQFEQNTTASAFTVPGTWFPLYAGMVERYPQAWNDSGAFGTVTPTAVDTFALLSQVQFTDLMTAAIQAPRSVSGAGLSFCYRLGEQAGSTQFADATGQRGPAVVAPTGGVTAGVAQTSASPGGGYAAAPGTTVVNFNPGANAGTQNYLPEPCLILPPGPDGLYGPPRTGGFTRMVAFRQTNTTGGQDVWCADSPSSPTSTATMEVYQGSFYLEFADHNGGGATVNLGAVSVGNWHLAFISTDPAGLGWHACVDGVVFSGTFAKPWNPPDFFSADTIAADAISGVNNEFVPFAGDISWACQWPFQLSAAQMQQIYQIWRSAGAGDSTGQRYARILGLAGYQGPSLIDPGQTTNLPAATDIAGQDALTALSQVVTTENGQHFVDAGGIVRFADRSRRARAQAPTFVFGENTAAGELPYDTVAFDFDPTRIGNDIQITQNSSGTVFRAFDAASQAAYGIRTVTRTTQASNALEVQDAAHYLLGRYSKARMRISALTLNPGTNPALWPVCLALELGTRIRVNRRPPGAPVITFDGFVEAINWNADDGANATVDIQVSPADGWTAWTDAAMHFTYAGNLINGTAWYPFGGLLTDPAGNPVHANLSIGQRIAFLTTAGTSYPVTVTGLDGNGAGSVQLSSTAAATGPFTVCDLLPAGVTDPTSFDSMAVLGKTTTLGY